MSTEAGGGERRAALGTPALFSRLVAGETISQGTRVMADEGVIEKAKGAIREVIGKVTGDKRTEAEGRTDQARGDVKHGAHDVSETARGVGDSLTKD